MIFFFFLLLSAGCGKLWEANSGVQHEAEGIRNGIARDQATASRDVPRGIPGGRCANGNRQGLPGEGGKTSAAATAAKASPRLTRLFQACGVVLGPPQGNAIRQRGRTPGMMNDGIARRSKLDISLLTAARSIACRVPCGKILPVGRSWSGDKRWRFQCPRYSFHARFAPCPSLQTQPRHSRWRLCLRWPLSS